MSIEKFYVGREYRAMAIAQGMGSSIGKVLIGTEADSKGYVTLTFEDVEPEEWPQEKCGCYFCEHEDKKLKEMPCKTCFAGSKWRCEYRNFEPKKAEPTTTTVLGKLR